MRRGRFNNRLPSAFLSERGRPVSPPYRIRCYDTSLYFDDLPLGDEREAAARLAAEVCGGTAPSRSRSGGALGICRSSGARGTTAR